MASVCVRKESTTWPLLQDRLRLGVSILSAEHEIVCRALAAKGVDRFANVDWEHSDSGAVFISGSSAWLECDIARIVELQLAAQRGGRRTLEKAARVKVSRLDAEHDRVAAIDAAFLESARAVGYVGMRQVAQSAVRWAGLAEAYRAELTPDEVEALQSVWLQATRTRVPA